MTARRVNGSGPVPARLLLLGEAPGAEEEAQGAPFVGASGAQLDTWLSASSINRFDARLTNVFRTRPQDNDIDNFVTWKRKDGEERGWSPRGGAWVHPAQLPDLSALAEEILAVRPNLIVTLGRTPLWALCKLVPKIGDMRGNLFEAEVRGEKFKVLPTYHPAYVLRSWADRPLALHDLRRARREMEFPGLKPRVEDFTLRPSLPQVLEWGERVLHSLSQGPVPLSVDIETRGAWIACVGFATSRTEAICVPLMCVEAQAGYWGAADELTVVRLLRSILAHPNIRCFGANFLFDTQYLQREWLVTPRVADDVQLMHHTLFSPFRKALGQLVTWYADQPRYYKAEGREWTARQPEEQLWTYNCRDVVYTYEIWEALNEQLDKTGQRPQYEFMLSLFYPILHMIERGLRVDLEQRKVASAELTATQEERLAWIEKIAGHKLNPNSPLQMKSFFYRDLKIKPVLSHGEPRGETVDDEALDIICLREPVVTPLVQAIKDVRKAAKIRATFVDVQLDPDERIRCSINLTGAKTFRFSSSSSPFDTGTNLQTIPRNPPKIVFWLKEHGPLTKAQLTESGFRQKDLDEAEKEEFIRVSDSGLVAYRFAPPAVRRLFVADPGFTIVDMDLERADLQVDAWESGDEKLKQLLRAGVDIHEENAKVIGFSRQVAKVFVHATHKGAKARTIAQHCNITVAEAERGQRRWFAEHPAIRSLHERIAELAVSTRPILTNVFGQRFPLLGRGDEAFKEGVAWLAQSVVARVINTALVNLDKLPHVQMLLQVHDSLVFQVPNERDGDADMEELRKHALIPVPYDDPLIIPVGFKRSRVSWGDCK